jgi:hypothetical protein
MSYTPWAQKMQRPSQVLASQVDHEITEAMGRALRYLHPKNNHTGKKYPLSARAIKYGLYIITFFIATVASWKGETNPITRNPQGEVYNLLGGEGAAGTESSASWE